MPLVHGASVLFYSNILLFLFFDLLELEKCLNKLFNKKDFPVFDFPTIEQIFNVFY